jgi:hypothetical protein
MAAQIANPLGNEIATLMMHIERSKAVRGAVPRVASTSQPSLQVHATHIDGMCDTLSVNDNDTPAPDHNEEHPESNDVPGDPVTEWLFELGLEQYAVPFAEAGLDGEAIIKVTKSDFLVGYNCLWLQWRDACASIK